MKENKLNIQEKIKEVEEINSEIEEVEEAEEAEEDIINLADTMMKILMNKEMFIQIKEITNNKEITETKEIIEIIGIIEIIEIKKIVSKMMTIKSQSLYQGDKMISMKEIQGNKINFKEIDLQVEEDGAVEEEDLKDLIVMKEMIYLLKDILIIGAMIEVQTEAVHIIHLEEDFKIGNFKKIDQRGIKDSMINQIESSLITDHKTTIIKEDSMKIEMPRVMMMMIEDNHIEEEVIISTEEEVDLTKDKISLIEVIQMRMKLIPEEED
jgi:hypothetical protein